MPDLIVWKNQEIDRLKKDMDRLIARLWDDFCTPLFHRVPREDYTLALSETEDSLFLTAEVPGISPEDLEVTIEDDILTIRGDVRQDVIAESGGYETREKHYGFFSRTIQLPCRVLTDDVKATYKHGILTIVMPKCKAEYPRGIKIKVT